jgi:5-oxoprolinase (ATP-hydrolysing)
VARALAPDLLEIDEDWLPPEVRAAAGEGEAAPLLAGCRFRRLGRDAGGGAGVLGFDPGLAPVRSRLRLDGPVAASAGDPFELLSDEEAPVLAARLLTCTPSDRPLPPVELRLATTRGTNALLERKGAPVALFVTRGFGDLLAIGDQSRPDLFDPAPVKPEPLYARAVEVAERRAADGEVLVPLDLEDPALGERVRELVESGVRSAAVALLHSYLDPTHERLLGRFLAERGFDHVSLSAELAPLIKIVPRAETAVVDAYLAPIVGGYVERVAEALPSEGATLHLMTSAGGLARAGDYRAKDSLLSGPAGGVVGAAEAGRRSGFERVIAFDMGGTSTDVSRYDGGHEYLFEHRVGDARLLAPALAIETVAAGGGSICRFAGGRLLVGPESAGADPGPACYGAGGPLTLTDVNLLLGRLDPERFGIPVDPAAAERRLDRLMDELMDELAGAVGAAGGGDREALLAGCLEIADERMADAVRRISLRRGYDPAGYALVAFGGAGGQHAASLAGHLGVERVLVPRDAGLLSAVGLDAAVVERFAQRQVLAPLENLRGGLGPALAELAGEAVAAVAAEEVPRERIEVRRRIVELRLAGQETTLSIEAPEGSMPLAEALAARFADAYRDLYGYPPPARPVEVESIRVAASSRRTEPMEEGSGSAKAIEERPARPAGTRRAWFGDWREVPVFEREALAPGDRFDGPALVFERHASTVVPPGWELRVDAAGAFILARRS